MQVTLIGIIGNTLYIAPMYGGDNEHTAIVSKSEKTDLIERGVKELPNRDHVDAYLYGKTYEEFLEMLENWKLNEVKHADMHIETDDDLPF